MIKEKCPVLGSVFGGSAVDQAALYRYLSRFDDA